MTLAMIASEQPVFDIITEFEEQMCPNATSTLPIDLFHLANSVLIEIQRLSARRGTAHAEANFKLASSC
jgi:hypothetical protein